VLNIPDKGSAVLSGRISLMALRKADLKTRALQDRGSTEGYDNALFERLRAVRKRMAEAQQVPPYIIFSDKTLHELCRRVPLTLSDMRKISGVGDSKLERYGKDFIREIGLYIDKNPTMR
jgi:ATP-dependent DNA helicase RecQ